MQRRLSTYLATWDRTLGRCLGEPQPVPMTVDRDGNNLPETISFSRLSLHGMAPNVLVRPILEYGCSDWDSHQARQIANLEEKIHKGAARIVTGNYSLFSGSITLKMGKLDWVPQNYTTPRPEKLTPRPTRSHLMIFSLSVEWRDTKQIISKSPSPLLNPILNPFSLVPSGCGITYHST